MTKLREWFTRFWGSLRPDRRDVELEQELRLHLDLASDEARRQGHTSAARAATVRFGGVPQAMDALRDQRGLPWIDNLARDGRHAFRALRRSPTFTAAAVLSLALAIGANVSIFAVVQRVLLNPLPYPQSDRLMAVEFRAPRLNIPTEISMLPSRLFYQFVNRARTLQSIALYSQRELTLTGNGEPERAQVIRATPSLASVLRVSPALGRWFTEEEGAPRVSPVAVLSHGLWVRRYGGDAAVLGRLVTLDGVQTTVIGVMPVSFAFPDPHVDLWIPEPLTPAMASDSYNFRCVARLRDGTTVAQARGELNRLTADLSPAWPGHAYEMLVSTAKTLIEATVGDTARALWILLASVGVVLLLACANVANLFLVRAESRQREIAIRRALGAGTGGIARYFLAESALLSIAGGAAGLTLAWGAIHLLVAFGPANLPRLEEVRLDGVVLTFTFALSLLTAVLLGGIPLLRLRPLAMTLHESGRGNTAGPGQHRARHLLMAGQMALALVLLISSGLMLRSFQKLRNMDPGFDVTSALTFRIGLPRTEYQDREHVFAAHYAMLDRLAALPGVTVVSATTWLPLSEQRVGNGPLFVEGRVRPPGSLPPIVAYRAIAGDYFKAMGMRLLRGRGIDRRDGERQELIAVVNEALTTAFFLNQNPIGQRITLGDPARARGPVTWLTVGGVVANTPTNALIEAKPVPTMYVPVFAHEPGFAAADAMSYVVRTSVPPRSVVTAARAAIGAVDPHVPVADVRTLQDILDRASAQMAFTMALLVVAASVALTLGMIGIYGVTSYIVSQRTNEIGVRLALGAAPARIAALILQQGGRVALVGIAAGLTTAFASSRLIESLLYGVSSRDPIVFGAAALTSLAIALVACWLPARRAASVDPLIALRTQ